MFYSRWRIVINDNTLIRTLVNHKLEGVLGSFYISNDNEIDDQPMDIWLFFHNSSILHIYGHSNGWNMCVDNKEPNSIDMQEAGEFCIRDYAQKSVFKDIIGKELKSVKEIHPPSEGTIIGYQFDFGTSIHPVILNWGDELYISDRYPEDCKMDEIIEKPVQ